MSINQPELSSLSGSPVAVIIPKLSIPLLPIPLTQNFPQSDKTKLKGK